MKSVDPVLEQYGVQSRKLKFYLRRAGVTRPDLFASDATRKAMTFHDLRATGITWMAVRGDDPLKIMQRAGHEDFETTKVYLREAENLAGGFGAVFPPVPGEVLRGWSFGSISDPEPSPDSNALELLKNLVEPTGIEPLGGDFENPKPNADLTFNHSKSRRKVPPVPFHAVPSRTPAGCRVTAT